MRLVTYLTAAGARFGIETDGIVLDIAAAQEAVGGSAPVDVHAVMEGGAAALAALRETAERAAGRPEFSRPLAELRLAPCVPRPQKIICVGLNYRKHAVETGLGIPTSPVLFAKFANSLAGSGSSVPLPFGSAQIDYEAELAMVIGRRAEDVPADQALDYVFGYCNANDLSARDLQFRNSQWLLGKTLDGFCPLGPTLVTADEIANPNQLTVRCTVNGALRQHSSTADMIFACEELVSYISRYVPLEPGDVILTGTPEGVVQGYPETQRQALWLKDGDTVAVEIDGLGCLTNPMRRKS
jgi:2-keto-4-pentenoate hydratase/2-oxohepta-3-ene-1,7-dioic acid hydratase in catechol pathway